MSARRVALASLLLAVAAVVARPARAADEEVTEPVKAALVAAATSGDGAAMAKALEAANGLVGPSATFPDLGALADWFGTLPPPVPAHRTIRARRGWMYVVARRGADALELLKPLLVEEPGNALYRSYLGEAYRQAGDVPNAIAELAAALRAGATDDAVVPSVHKLLFDLKTSPPGGARADVAPAYVTAATTLFALRPMPAVRLAIVTWLADDLARAKADPARSGVLRAALAGEIVVTARLALPEGEAPRLAKTAYAVAQGMEASPAGGATPGAATRFDVLAVAVRLGERPGGEGHDLPEALADLAEEALAKGRYLLADALARRRLSISDSPTARRVLRALPPDLGD